MRRRPPAAAAGTAPGPAAPAPAFGAAPAAALGLALALAMPLLAGCLSGPDGAAGVAGFGGLVVSSNPLAAEAGAAMLRAGGSAADAAAAVQWVLTVVEPAYSGIGGGAFVLMRDGPTGAVTFLDGRETAPAATTADQFQVAAGHAPFPGDVSTMGHAVGVPGTVAVFAELHARAGRLPWADTFPPAVALAEEGFAVDASLAAAFEDGGADRLRSWPASARIYLPGAVCPPDVGALSAPTGCVGGEAPGVGETLRNPDLGATLRTLAAEGPGAFYRGPIAEAIALTTQQRLGRMTPGDLAAYEVVERTPARAWYRGHEVLTAPAPGGGPVLAEMLHVLDGLPAPAGGDHSPASLHAMVEAMRLAYADRARYNADPDHVPVPERGLAHPDYAAERRALIDPDRRRPGVEPGDPWAHENRTGSSPPAPRDHRRDGHTTHFIAVDREGTIVSVTSTIEFGWGTGMVVPGHGFLLNNELTDFDHVPGGANEPGPDKRPRSSMVPAIVLREGAPVLVLGAAGGPTITTSVLQVIVRVLDHGMDVARAVAAPRIFAPFGEVYAERTLPAELRSALTARGHPVEEVDGISGLQAASLVQGRWTGAPDPRHGGGGLAVVPAGDVAARGG